MIYEKAIGLYEMLKEKGILPEGYVDIQENPDGSISFFRENLSLPEIRYSANEVDRLLRNGLSILEIAKEKYRLAAKENGKSLKAGESGRSGRYSIAGAVTELNGKLVLANGEGKPLTRHDIVKLLS